MLWGASSSPGLYSPPLCLLLANTFASNNDNNTLFLSLTQWHAGILISEFWDSNGQVRIILLESSIRQDLACHQENCGFWPAPCWCWWGFWPWRPRRRRPRRVSWGTRRRCSTKCSSWERRRVSTVSDSGSAAVAYKCRIAHILMRVFPLLRLGTKKVINSELWHACAGPLVCLPQRGSLVYYFPQGHSEQVRMDSEYSVPHLRTLLANVPGCYVFFLLKCHEFIW